MMTPIKQLLRVHAVEERKRTYNWTKHPDGTTGNSEISLGYFVVVSFDGKVKFAISFGAERPDLAPGDHLEVLLTKKET